jgi:hypothetical protein
MEHVETPPETGTATSVSSDSVSLRQRWTLRAAVIRLLEACLQRLQRPHSTSVIALLPAPDHLERRGRPGRAQRGEPARA